MSYTSPRSPIEFKFDANYVAPIGAISFNLGISEKDAIGIIDATLDNCIGEFTGFLPQKYEGVFSATLDDCTGEISAAWLVQPKTLTASFSIPSNTAKVETLCVTSVSKTAEKITDETRFEILTAQQLDYSTLSSSQQAIVKRNETLSRVQQATLISKNTHYHATDLHAYTHKFDSVLFKEPPPKYRYTPTAVFDFGVHLNEWTLSTTTNEYVASLPVNFDLNESEPIGANFDLGLTNTQPVTRTRKIFDNVSTYQPESVFFVPWVNDALILNHSYQRAAMRIATNAPVKRAVKRDKSYLFKLQNAVKVVLSFAQKLRISKKLAKNVSFKTKKSVKISRRYREIYQIAKIIWNSNQPIIINDPPRPIIPPPINHVTVTIPTKTAYIMQHTITVTLEDLTPIEVDGLKLSVDVDSFAWSFSCTLLNLSQLPLVKQPTNAPPVILIITINGEVFKMLVEKIVRNREFAKNSVSLTGRSLSALLSSPYEQPRSATQSSLMNVQQLCALELPSGWTLNWTAADWVIPAGAYSYTSKTPIQVITEIAASIGAVVVPSKDSKTLTVQPRYPVLPWNFDTTAPDLVIPDAAIVSLTYRNIVPTQANAVYIHGSEIGGVLSRCRLTGTAGDRLSPTVTNSLMTDVVGTRQLGEKILADNYEQPAIQSITIPLGGDYPLLKEGDFVRINDGEGVILGVINSVSIDNSFGKVRQTVQIGNESANVWTAFKEIMPSSPLLVGTVSSVTGETSLMTLVDGGVIRCRGVGQVGEKWYVRNGALESKAPSLMLSEIVV